MRIKLQNELVLINILAILVIIIVTLFPSNALRVILGLPFVLFFPGFTLTAALFPRENALDAIERMGLSFGLSIAVVSFIGLALNFTPLGIRLYPILISLTIFIVATSIIAWYRQRRLTQAERPTVSFNLNLAIWRGQTSANKVLYILLAVVILGTIGTLGYILSKPMVGEKFTEFYVLGLESKAVDYLAELKIGEEGRVVVGIINREHQTVTYRIEVRINGVINNEVKQVILRHDEKWEEITSFIPERAGDNQKVEFLLYRNGESEPYLKPLHLWVNIEE